MAVSKDARLDKRHRKMNSYVYMLRCADGSYYVGKTDRPLAERIGDHGAGLGGRYTSSRRPVTLVWSQDFDRYSDAVAAERQIKGWRRVKKEALIRGEWVQLPESAKRSTVLRDGASRRSPADRSSAPPQDEALRDEVSGRDPADRSSTSPQDEALRDEVSGGDPADRSSTSPQDEALRDEVSGGDPADRSSAPPQDEAVLGATNTTLHPEEGVEEARRAVSKRPSRRTERLSQKTATPENALFERQDAETDAAFDITVYLPYLINRTGVELAGAFSREIGHHGVTLQMWRVLAALHHRDGLRISDLAGLTSIEISTLSRLIGKMERQGLATRGRGPQADGRVVAVFLTPAGRAATRAILPVAQRYETVALAGFTADEAAALKQMLIRVYANLAGEALDSAA